MDWVDPMSVMKKVGYKYPFKPLYAMLEVGEDSTPQDIYDEVTRPHAPGVQSARSLRAMDASDDDGCSPSGRRTLRWVPSPPPSVLASGI